MYTHTDIYTGCVVSPCISALLYYWEPLEANTKCAASKSLWMITDFLTLFVPIRTITLQVLRFRCVPHHLCKTSLETNPGSCNNPCFQTADQLKPAQR